MRRKRTVVLVVLFSVITVAALAGSVRDYFEAERGTIAVTESDWRADQRLQNHGITEIAFERPKSSGKAQWDAYSVKFFADGRVEFVGSDKVRKLGAHVGRIPPQEFQRLALLTMQLNYESLDSHYRRPVLGTWTTYTSITRHGRVKVIQNYADAGPVQLWAIELAIQDLVKHITWES